MVSHTEGLTLHDLKIKIVKPTNMKELSEEDLEKVAGGVTPTFVIVSTVAVYFGISQRDRHARRPGLVIRG